jgi:hypothetical protein
MRLRPVDPNPKMNPSPRNRRGAEIVWREDSRGCPAKLPFDSVCDNHFGALPIVFPLRLCASAVRFFLRITADGSAARIVAAWCLVVWMAGPRPCAAASGDGDGRLLEEPPNYGLYYDEYEPAFYTGFAPRTLDPRRLHVHLGRGNQLRVTAVLDDDVLRDYAKDLLERERTYRALVRSGRLALTQNHALQEFERTLGEAQVARLVAEGATLPRDAVQERNLQLLERLNPGRVFRIRMPIGELLRRWVAAIKPEDHTRMDARRRLELLNLMLPTRMFVADLDPETSRLLEALVRRCPEDSADPTALDQLRPAFVQLLERATHGIYPLRGDALQFAEFTAVYPVGTFNQYTSINGRQIPEYPTPGRRALTTHQRTQTVDHVPTDGNYSYFPWLPYMHVGTRLHNAVHTLFWRMKPAETPFLPAAWRNVKDADGRPYRYLWLLSRGPMSHGCTHLNAGHISELRQLLPSETEPIYKVDVLYNKSFDYDVFDVDGDFEPEVMGVRYFIAYSLKNDKPDRLRVRNERRAYYDWLYGGELEYDASDRGVFPKITDGRFIGRTAVEGAEYERIPLYEAAYQPEKIQFYRLVDIPFAKELRKIGARYRFPGLDTTAVVGR